jgi:hypothetical protein
MSLPSLSQQEQLPNTVFGWSIRESGATATMGLPDESVMIGLGENIYGARANGNVASLFSRGGVNLPDDIHKQPIVLGVKSHFPVAFMIISTPDHEGVAKVGSLNLRVWRGDSLVGEAIEQGAGGVNSGLTRTVLYGIFLRRDPPIMLTGDNARVAKTIAQTANVTDVRADLLPESKVTAIRELIQQHGQVAMVGDGVNDAPALANATVGIAMGAGGTDVALETADIALMSDDLSKLPFAVALSRQSRAIIRQNLWIALGVIAILVPSTLFVSPAWASRSYFMKAARCLSSPLRYDCCATRREMRLFTLLDPV